MNLYIDKSKNEQGEQEFSIHGLSKQQILLIQFFIKKGDAHIKTLKGLTGMANLPLPEDTKSLIELISNFDANA
jgi:hypothetical protein